MAEPTRPDPKRVRALVQELTNPLAHRCSNYLFVVVINGQRFYRYSDEAWAEGMTDMMKRHFEAIDDPIPDAERDG